MALWKLVVGLLFIGIGFIIIINFGGIGGGVVTNPFEGLTKFYNP